MKKSTFNSAILAVCVIALLLAGGAAAWVLTGGFSGNLRGPRGIVVNAGGGEGAGIVGGKDEISGGTISSGKVALSESGPGKVVAQWLKENLDSSKYDVVKEYPVIKAGVADKQLLRVKIRTPNGVTGADILHDWVFLVDGDSATRMRYDSFVSENADDVFSGKVAPKIE